MSEQLRVLFIGDPHVTVEELPDCARLLTYVDRIACEEKPDLIVFLGDQHHNHAVIRVEVLDFWQKWFEARQSKDIPVYMLVGNHDRSHDASVTGNTLRYTGNCLVVTHSMRHGPLAFVSWQPTQDAFRDQVKSATAANQFLPQPATVLVCHQTFAGSRYENGFYAPDGFAAEELPATLVISGHIHTPQAFGKVWYPGAPRWRIATDANTERALPLVTFDAVTGAVLDRKLFETEKVCIPLVVLEDTEGGVHDIMTPGLGNPNARVTVNVRGTQEYVTSRASFWKAKGYRVVPFPTREAKHKVRESDGISTALKKHIETYEPRFGSDLSVLQKLVAERIQL